MGAGAQRPSCLWLPARTEVSSASRAAGGDVTRAPPDSEHHGPRSPREGAENRNLLGSVVDPWGPRRGTWRCLGRGLPSDSRAASGGSSAVSLRRTRPCPPTGRDPRPSRGYGPSTLWAPPRAGWGTRGPRQGSGAGPGRAEGVLRGRRHRGPATHARTPPSSPSARAQPRPAPRRERPGDVRPRPLSGAPRRARSTRGRRSL